MRSNYPNLHNNDTTTRGGGVGWGVDFACTWLELISIPVHVGVYLCGIPGRSIICSDFDRITMTSKYGIQFRHGCSGCCGSKNFDLWEATVLIYNN